MAELLDALRHFDALRDGELGGDIVSQASLDAVAPTYADTTVVAADARRAGAWCRAGPLMVGAGRQLVVFGGRHGRTVSLAALALALCCRPGHCRYLSRYRGADGLCLVAALRHGARRSQWTIGRNDGAMNEPPVQEVVRDIPREIAKELTGMRHEYCITHCPTCLGNHVTVKAVARQRARVCPYCRRMPISKQGDLGVLCLTYEGRVMPKKRIATLDWLYLKPHLLLTARATAAEVHVGRRQARRQGLDKDSVTTMVRATDRLAAINDN